jgi:hypothetical protein
MVSCNAAATISEADAELPLTRTASGRPAARSSCLASKNWWLSGDRDRLVQQSAGIVAQVEYEALQLLALFALGLKDLLAQGLGRILVEPGDAQVADVAFGPVTHGLGHDVGAGQVEFQGLRHGLPRHGQR